MFDRKLSKTKQCEISSEKKWVFSQHHHNSPEWEELLIIKPEYEVLVCFFHLYYTHTQPTWCALQRDTLHVFSLQKLVPGDPSPGRVLVGHGPTTCIPFKRTVWAKRKSPWGRGRLFFNKTEMLKSLFFGAQIIYLNKCHISVCSPHFILSGVYHMLPTQFLQVLTCPSLSQS